MYSFIKNVAVSLAVIVIVVGVSVISNLKPQQIINAATYELTGWVWASGDQAVTPDMEGGIGWISLNCKTGGLSGENVCVDNGGPFDYGVAVSDDANHTLSGYAWSEYLGWIRFDGLLSGCPSGGACGARIVTDGATGWKITGWARACAAFASGCDGALAPATVTGGYDGWISLDCENMGTCATSNYAVRLNQNGQFLSANSFAWGDTMLNWLNFGYAALTGPLCASTDVLTCSADATTAYVTTKNMWCEETTVPQDCAALGLACSVADGGCSASVPNGTLSVQPGVVRQGQNVTVSWTTTNATVCEVTGPNFSATGLADSVPYTPQSQAELQLVCDGQVIDTVTIFVIPSVYES